MRKRAWAISAAVLAIAILTIPAAAEVKLPAIIGDNMCLQQDTKVPIWGWATAGEQVTVTLGQQKHTAVADKDGKWMVKLDALKAGGPMEMTVAGSNTLTVKNILVGEVWLCGGQSNMGYAMKLLNNAEQEIAEAKYPKMRLFTPARAGTDEPQADCVGKWVECEPSQMPPFSSIGYYFGRGLHQWLDVPVGLINSSVGGTPVEAWTSRAIFDSQPELLRFATAAYAQTQAKFAKRLEDWEAQKEQKLANWEKAAEAARAASQSQPFKPAAPNPPVLQRPSGLYNGMIAPLVPYAMRGVIWYQGEANTDHPPEYRKLFPAVIADWRAHWGQGDFPFLFVQLANFRNNQPQNTTDGGYPRLREAQLMTLDVAPNTAMAVVIDAGDPDNIHPKDKQTPAKRLLLAAQKVAYGKDIVYSGPIYRSGSMKIDGNKVTVAFQHIGGGLVAKGQNLVGFSLSGEDKKFVPADAAIEGDTVIITGDAVAAPVAVRYAWANNPICNLYNKEGLPASPFRTDTWPRATSEPASESAVPAP